MAAAVAATLLANWFFTPPLHTFTVSDTVNVIALIVFIGVAGIVSTLVTQSGRRSLEASRARSEAGTLVQLAAALLTEDDPLPSIMSQLLAAFGNLRSLTVLRRSGERAWRVVETTGEPIPKKPEEATDTVELDADDVLAIIGPDLTADERRVLHGFTSQLAVALESRELRAEASAATALAQADALRTALLRAVSHDLRTPLASIKAASTTLLADDVELSSDAVHQLQKTIDEEADRLNELVTNLLGMSRLQAGALQPATTDIGVDEVVSRAVAGLGERGRTVALDVPDDLPRIHAEPALLERALANLIDNALAWSPDDRPVRVQAGMAGGQVVVRVVDCGAGIPRDQRERVFQPFQRLGDRSSGAGVGLGLAVARGFVESMAGTLEIEDTPGGGTTMVVSFQAAQ